MAWARFDDLYDDNRKIKRAWRQQRAAVGLHAMAVTYCSRHETDGRVDVDWLEEKLPKDSEREKVLRVLVDVGLFVEVDDEHYRVKDYLDFNPSKATLDAKRAADAKRKRKSSPHGIQAESERNPDGGDTESEGNPGLTRAPASAARPSPSQPVPTPVPPKPPKGGRTRDLFKWESVAVAYAESVGVTGPRENVLRAVKGAVAYAGITTPDEFRSFARQNFPSLNVVASLPDERSAA